MTFFIQPSYKHYKYELKRPSKVPLFLLVLLRLNLDNLLTVSVELTTILIGSSGRGHMNRGVSNVLSFPTTYLNTMVNT